MRLETKQRRSFTTSFPFIEAFLEDPRHRYRASIVIAMKQSSTDVNVESIFLIVYHNVHSYVFFKRKWIPEWYV